MNKRFHFWTLFTVDRCKSGYSRFPSSAPEIFLPVTPFTFIYSTVTHLYRLSGEYLSCRLARLGRLI